VQLATIQTTQPCLPLKGLLDAFQQASHGWGLTLEGFLDSFPFASSSTNNFTNQHLASPVKERIDKSLGLVA